MPRSERQGEIFKGSLLVTTPGGAGIGVVGSGLASAVVSCPLVSSANPIFLTPRAINTGSPSFIGSGQPALGVSSIVENTSFIVATAGGIVTTGPIGFSYFVMR